MLETRAAYDELYVYTMGRGTTFILQHVVDAFSAQAAYDGSKQIAVTFALVGLYLHVEHRFTGREVQLAHIRLGKQRRQWPVIALPDNRGDITAIDVLAVPEGDARDAAIDAWCGSVWTAYAGSRQAIVDLLRDCQIVP